MASLQALNAYLLVDAMAVGCVRPRTPTTFGSQAAEWSTTAGTAFVSIPGPSTPIATSQSADVLCGDSGFVMTAKLLTSHASQWMIDEVVPTSRQIYTSAVVINASFNEFSADANYLYWREIISSEATPDVIQRYLQRSGPDGTGGYQLCTSWVSDVLLQDTTHLYGLEQVSTDQWLVDSIKKL